MPEYEYQNERREPRPQNFHKTDERILARLNVPIERKNYDIQFREGRRGKFLRVTEFFGGNRSTIIVPAEGIRDFVAAINSVSQ